VKQDNANHAVADRQTDGQTDRHHAPSRTSNTLPAMSTSWRGR